MNSRPRKAEVFTTGPISKPVVVPELETVQMNGFAWSADVGMMIALSTNDDIDKLRMRAEEYQWGKSITRPSDA